MPPTQTDSSKYNNNNGYGSHYDKSLLALNTHSNSNSNHSNMERHNIIVFDWDDTLLASTFLSSKGYRLDTDRALLLDIEKSLQELETSIITVLNTALQHGEVHIITNAETGWVELSAAKFIPSVAIIKSCYYY
jgi:predicted 2-oxoglutarate/Fe(II)-dependent dioxygenase YbiX